MWCVEGVGGMIGCKNLSGEDEGKMNTTASVLKMHPPVGSYCRC